MSDKFTKRAWQVIQMAGDIANRLSHNYVGTEHILIALLEIDGVAQKILRNNGVEEDKLIEMVNQLIAAPSSIKSDEPEVYTPRAKRIIEQSKLEAEALNSEEAGTEHILIALLKEQDCIAVRLLNTLSVNIPKLYAETLSATGMDPADIKNEMAVSLNKTKGKSKTPTLDQYSKDLTEYAEDGKLDPVIGRETEILRVIQILSRRTKNNPCLVGEPGVGKTAVVEALALRIVSQDVPDILKEKRLMMLDLSGVVAGSKYRGEFEERIKKIIAEAVSDGNILLFIDELHTIIGAGGAEGALDASNILKPSLARGELQLIGATTNEEYRKYIEKDAALERRFQPISVEEPSEEETIKILMGLRYIYEKHHDLIISDDAVTAAVKLAIRYINDRFLPDKAIDLLDEAAAKAKLAGSLVPQEIKLLSDIVEELGKESEEALAAQDYAKARRITKKQDKYLIELNQKKAEFVTMKSANKMVLHENDIAQMVSDWTNIPVSKLTEGESERLLKLEDTLHQRVIGQEEAVNAVAKAIRRGRVGLKDPNRPTGSFLFLGPTGVGKTELSKALAEAVFGDEASVIRVDMSEYMEKHSVSKMIGSPPGYVGYDEGGQLSEKVRKKPYSVILFDEIEKAHPDVFNILLQVLDDGHITDSQGRKVSFKNTIIIMTSNAGASSIISPKKLGFMTVENNEADYARMKDSVMEEVKTIFKPEFLNRIDEIIVFHSLTKDNLRDIIRIMIATVSKRSREQMNLSIKVEENAVEFLLEKGSDDKYGARPLRRAIQTHIEDKLAEEVLSGKVLLDDTVTISSDGEKIVIQARRKPGRKKKTI